MSAEQNAHLSKLKGHRNLTDRVYERIQKAITGLAIKAGEEIQEVRLAQQLGTSVTPVREALHRLVGDGLIVREPNKRPRVIVLTEREINDLYDLRGALESFGASLAAQNAKPNDIESLRDLQKRGEEYHRAGMIEEYKAYNDQFHEKIVSLSGNKLLVQMMEAIRNKNRLCVSSTVMIPGRSQQAIEEHRELISALEEGDPRGARETMSRHIQLAKEAFLESYREEVLKRETTVI